MTTKSGDNDDHFKQQQNRRKWYQITPYLDSVEVENILAYKFHGGCDAWMYIKFWSPFADWLVEHTLPKSLAANIVTLFGFSWTVIPAIWLFGAYGTNFSNPDGIDIPWWMFIFQSVSYFLARIIDEMDGKQARRLKNGSILGLMVDHGCDGYAMGFFSLILMKIGQGGDNIWCLAAINLATFVFYISTLEHYYTANHFMGNGNMVTDGSVLVIVIFGALAFTGNDFFADLVDKTDKSDNTTWGLVFDYVMIGLGSVNALGYSYHAITHKPNEFTTKKFNCLEFTLQLLGFIVMSFVTSSLLFMGGGKGYQPLYYKMADKTAFEGQLTPLLAVLLVQNFLMAHMNFSVIMCHVTSQVFNPFKNKLFLFTMFYVLAIYTTIKLYPEQQKHMMRFIYVLFGINFIGQFHMVISLARQLQQILKVPFWTPFDPEERDKILAADKELELQGSGINDAELQDAN